MKVSVLVLTLNEGDNIVDCLKSVSDLTDDIVVLDSKSTDDTVAKALDFGCRIVEKDFDGWDKHQNWALKNIHFKYEWILYIDADERVTENLKAEIKNLAIENYKGYKIYRDNRFLNGEPLKNSMKCPGIVRLFSKNYIRYERDINPVAIVNGPVGKLNSSLLHFNFSKGLDEWIIKHLDYARREGTAFRTDIDNNNINFMKRRSQKIRYFRFFFRMFYQLFIKMGLLDGYVGFRYAVLISFYEHLIEENLTSK